MAGEKITEIAEITQVANDDLLTCVDISDTTYAADGTNKKFTKASFFTGWDGWISANETWTYASPTTIIVPSGAASRYQKGMPFKLTANSVVRQGYIVGVTSTVLTVRGDALTNHTFTNNFYGQSGTVPLGFKDWFTVTPTTSGSGSMTWGSLSFNFVRFKIQGLICTVFINLRGTTAGTANNRLQFSSTGLPTMTTTTDTFSGARIEDNGTIGGFISCDTPNQLINAGRYDDANFSLSALAGIRGEISYYI